jgi:hypothetical protein
MVVGMASKSKPEVNAFDIQAFPNPDERYRGAPLWSWNTKLDWPHLKDQIDDFRDMGMGGFHMHSRVGLDTPYLGKDFMNLVDKCVEYAKEKRLAACLYDEDRYILVVFPLKGSETENMS